MLIKVNVITILNNSAIESHNLSYYMHKAVVLNFSCYTHKGVNSSLIKVRGYRMWQFICFVHCSDCFL